ncbi:MAG: hypothetical protein CL917_16385 [Deltaproteobacteria bacterium]|nr:hypothetical protein [Deltaproteobacteria bacterium]
MLKRSCREALTLPVRVTRRMCWSLGPAGMLLGFMLLFPAGFVAAQYEQPEGERQFDDEYEDDVGRADGADFQEVDPDAPGLGDPYSGIEEVRVLGQQGGSASQEAVSEIGFDAYELQRDGIKDIRDLSNFTPNLEIKSAFGNSNATLFIRGVGIDDFNANSPSAVAVYQDNIYMQSPAGQLFQFFDVDGVEVLRGPQGVLFRNASAGVIKVISRKPSQDRNAYTNVTYGRFNQIEVEGAGGGGITDTLAGRVSGSWSRRDGIAENRCGIASNYIRPEGVDTADMNECWFQIVEKGNPLIGDVTERVNNADSYALRGQLLWEPDVSDGLLSFLLNVHGGQNASQAYQYQQYGVEYNKDATVASAPPVIKLTPDGQVFKTLNAAGYEDDDNDPFAGDYNAQGPENLNLWGTYLESEWEFGDGYTLKSVTGYEGHDRFIWDDSDASPVNILVGNYTDTSWQVTQELRLSGIIPAPVSFGDDVDWIVGAYYLKEDLQVKNTYDYGAGPTQTIEYEQDLRNFAVYGMATWTFLDNFTLQAGARQNWEQKSYDLVAFAKPKEATEALESKSGYEQGTFTGWGGNVTLTYQVLPEAEISAKYSRGWKGGHFNGGAFNSQALIDPVKPEIVDSFEIGTNSRWFDGRLSVNGAFFVYDYKDLQVFNLEQTSQGATISQLINAEHARVYGAEIDLQAEILEGLNVEFNFAWLDSTYLDFENSLEFVESRGCPQNCQRIQFTRDIEYSGNPLIASPRFSVASSIDYLIPLPSLRGKQLGYLSPRFSLTWRDTIYFDACSGRGTMCNFPKGTFAEDPLLLLNGSLGWWSDDERYQLTVWVRNLTDEQYVSQTFDQTGPEFKQVLEVYGEPRTYGVTLGIYFE